MMPISSGDYRTAAVLYRFVEEEAVAGSGLDTAQVWRALAAVLDAFSVR
ncbi:MAG: hypothetical protein JF615_02710, partial [Asticcacaulis sp.]|nr:hypothetical protein [Asticcacaulis sp.]